MKKVKMGVIGAGGIAYRRTIPGMLKAKNMELGAVMDVVGIEKIAKEFNVAKAYTKERDVINDPEIDAVYIATPAYLHLKHIKMSAEKGKHILCEKPLCVNLKDTREAINICKKNGVFLQEGYMMKFHGAHQKIKELIQEGKIGKVVYIRAQLSCWYPPIKGAWRQDPKKGGGGALIDMATHLYDLVEFFTDEQIRYVAAITNSQVQNYKSEDSSTTLIELTSGTHATVDCFFCIPDEASKTRLEIYGSQGSIFTEGTIGQSEGGVVEGIFGLGVSGYDAKQSKDMLRKFRNVNFRRINPYTAECEYFADCVLKNIPPQINGPKNSIHIAEVTEKAYISYRTKKILKIMS
ncbi:MAG: Gfo/Idh/MocA family oxidoreductase [Candidatus Ratteibacteria bacterium]|nr:Gfo/Idh/MocA family oxidoreductase [Candidatus Ratteibacteria bacterium]